MGASTSHPKIEGFCDPKYDKVKKHLEHMIAKGCDENIQLCVYVGGKCVVDLYGATNDNFDGNKTQIVFSSGKSLEAIVMAMLYDKGLFKYDDHVAQYWPEFAQNGKEGIRICDILRHESGMPYFTKSIPSFENAWKESIKQNKIGEFIEQQPAIFPEVDGIKFKREYHALSRGLMVNELVRRLHPEGKTMGEIIRDDIKVEGKIILGIENDSQMKNVFAVKEMSKGFVLRQTLTPKWAGKKIDFTLMDGFKMASILKGAMRYMEGIVPLFTEMGTKWTGDVGPWLHLVNTEKIGLKAECCSFNLQANAKGLAELASWMAFKGQGLMSEATWDEMHSEATAEYDRMFYALNKPGDKVRTRFTKGGVNLYQTLPDATKAEKNLNHNREGFYGWMGYGGSLFQWHPELKIGFSFVPSVLNSLEMANERGAVLQQLVKDCAMS